MNESDHDRLTRELGDRLAGIDGVTDLQTVDGEATTTTWGFVFDGKPYSLVVNETP